MEKTDKQTKNRIYKIVITGPESTGKSTIAKGLAKHFDTVWVEEYLRGFAENKYSKNQKLIYSDNLIIAKGQIELEEKAMGKANKFIFCDTDILQTIIYSIEYYNKVQPELEQLLESNNADLYLLLNLDIAWQEDPLRDKPNKREDIYNLIERTLIKYNKKYIVIKGKDENRLHNSIQAIKMHLNI